MMMTAATSVPGRPQDVTLAPPALLFAEQPLPEPCRAVLAAHPLGASSVPGCSTMPQASPARLHWQCIVEGLKLGCNTSSVCSMWSHTRQLGYLLGFFCGPKLVFGSCLYG